MSLAVQPRVVAARNAAERVRALNSYFFEDMGFRGDGFLDSRESLVPDDVLRRRSGYCVGLAAVYLALAGEINLPLRGVSTPTHLFVRYDDGREKINVELLNAGMSFDDNWYARQYHVPDSSAASGTFLKSLTEQEFLGYVYADLGTLYSKAGDFPACL